VLTSNHDKWYCYEGGGALKWRNLMPATPYNAAFGLDDVDNDNVAEAVAGLENGNIYCVNAGSGAYKWTYSTGSKTYSGSLAVDINCDGYRELVNGTYDGKLVALKSNGQLLFQLQISTAQVAGGCGVHSQDIDGDRYVELLVRDSNGKAICVGQSL
jgi:outer membrane protein assembly factor BamB